MADTNPANITSPDLSRPSEVLAQWQEPDQSADLPFGLHVLLIGGGVVAALFIGLGILLKISNFYFASGVIGAALLMLYSQVRSKRLPTLITVSSAGLEIGKKSLPLPLIAGFWLQKDGSNLVINIEQHKRTPFPVSFLFESNSMEKARQLFLQVMPELEPRTRTLADDLNHYLGL